MCQKNEWALLRRSWPWTGRNCVGNPSTACASATAPLHSHPLCSPAIDPWLSTQPFPEDALSEKSLALVHFVVNLVSFLRTGWKNILLKTNGLNLNSLSKFFWIQVKVIKCSWALFPFSPTLNSEDIYRALWSSVCFYNSELFDLYFATSLKNFLKGE